MLWDMEQFKYVAVIYLDKWRTLNYLLLWNYRTLSYFAMPLRYCFKQPVAKAKT